MERFDFSFNNKYVGLWFIWVLPVIIPTVVLILVLPVWYHWIPSVLPLIAVTVFYIWMKVDHNRNKK